MPAHEENAPDLDEIYGLEPVIEPGEGAAADPGAAGLQPWTVQCPYCGESFATAVDPSSGSTSYIEDCQVCCQPIEFSLEVTDEGTVAAVRVGRDD